MDDKAKVKKVKKEEDEDEDADAWWLNQKENEDESVKWTSLKHNGVYFPPEYVPHGIKMKYDGNEPGPFVLVYLPPVRITD